MCPNHSCTLFHFLLKQPITRIKANSTTSPLLDYGFDGEAERGGSGYRLTFPICLGSLPLHHHPQGCLAVVGGEPVAGCRKCALDGCCLLLMLFDILAGVLSVWLPRCCTCSPILKGSSVWAAVNCPLPPLFLSSYLSVSLSLHLSHPFIIIRIKTRVAGI